MSNKPENILSGIGKRYAVPTITALAATLYLLTLSRHYSADSIEFALAIESGNRLALIDAHHLLLHPLGWAFYQVWRLAGWTGGSLLPLQVLNALFGAVAVGLLFKIVRFITGALDVAWLVGIGFVVSGATWLLSTEAEFVTIPLAVQLGVLYLLLIGTPEQEKQPTYAVLMGLSTAFAALTYLSGAFLIPVAALATLLRKELALCVRLKHIGIICGIAVFSVLLIYTMTLELWDGNDLAILPALLSGGGVYGQLGLQNIVQGLYACLRSLGLYPNLGMNDLTSRFFADAAPTQRALFFGYYAILAVIFVLPIGTVIARRNQLWQAHSRTLTILLTWMILFGGFAFFWVPGDVSFWIHVIAAWWLLVALQMHEIRNLAKQSVRRLIGVSLCAGIGLLCIANAAFLILPHHALDLNQEYQIALSVAEHTSPDDLVLVDGDGPVAHYIIYFANRHVFPVCPCGEAFQNALQRALANTRARGGRVFAIHLDSSQSQIDAMVGKTVSAWDVAGKTVEELLP